MRKLLLLSALSAFSAVNAFHPAIARERPPPHPRQAEIDSLMQVASDRLHAKDAQEAIALCQQVTRLDSTHAPACCMLGSVYLSLGQLNEAEQAYQRARKIDNSADAWFGLGRVAVASGERKRKREALTLFREAVRRDWNHAEARYRLAQTLYDLGEPGAEFELQDLIRVNKTYKIAYLTLSQWEEPKPDGLKEALKWCERGLKALPDDPDLLARRLELRISAGDYDRAVEELRTLLKGQPDETRTLPLLAQAHLAKGRLKAADEAFRAYLDRLDPRERDYYEDISLVGDPEEAQALQDLPIGSAPEFLRQFWARRDVDLADGVNRRLLEHYRRVWVARTLFSRGKAPWDRRGEVYIRYGAPDFRQRSGGPDFRGALDPKVQRVRNRMATFLYGPVTNLGKNPLGIKTNVNSLDDFFAILSNTDQTQGPGEGAQVPFDASVGISREEGGVKLESPDIGLVTGPAYPMRASWRGYAIVAAGMSAVVPWEGWVYARISGGIEFVFTDEHMNDAYDFAPVPQINQPSGKRGLAGPGFLARLHEYAPEKVFGEVKAIAPAVYISPGPLEPLPAYASLTDFRGGPGVSRVEVSIGIPVKEIKLTGQGWQGTRTVVVYDRAWREVHRSSDRSALPVLPESKQEILDEIRVDLPPGGYFLALNVTEGDSGRTSLYRDSLRVADYRGDSLRVSGVELARQIAPTAEQGKFVKGKLRVLPAPSRAFEVDQGVSVYFEVYNLKPDAQGRTRYRVDYTVRSPKGVGDLVLGGLSQLIGRSQKGDEVTVSYESAGEATQEAVHTALDLRKGKEGDYTLQVTVTDLNSGTIESRETAFRVEK